MVALLAFTIALVVDILLVVVLISSYQHVNPFSAIMSRLDNNMICNSCKNKTSTERCNSRALKNLQFCGKHARSKHPRIWSAVNSTADKAILIQKLWRGWIARRYMYLAGPGVLKRSICHNTEDVITMEEKVHPHDYFAFEEDGKIFWFDIKSIFQISIGTMKPQNPYTRQELSLETRKRLKENIYYREVRLLPLFYDPLYLVNADKVIGMRWTMICQMIEENVFVEVDPMYFIALSRVQFWEFTAILRESLLLWAQEHNTLHSRRTIYYIWMNSCWKRQTLEVDSTLNVANYLGRMILRMLKDSKQPYELCFKVLSALHSL
jgi:hypothetical protein